MCVERSICAILRPNFIYCARVISPSSNKLDKPYPVHQLKEALNSANTIRLNKDIYLLQSTPPLFKTIRDQYQIGLDYKWVKVEKLHKELSKLKF
jgi:hypothetical protein